ncbi:RNA-binding S4 domain-containing protein [Pelagicoccus sp. SDUM812005]|uniref:RNA-binding S4 domain-containing protein n=1 Tax=Pelagicoccus sp. SDUM812005 TaxID=3041257 RepID=UPI00280FED46|nr:RNA-binding S4 domain-containing protein [Pelagicoccus sp. SDUM812005]MDQ8182512.1 RNA-binding S4 domain-containing protein [Pelagicoccus sp. SDUM812005]
MSEESINERREVALRGEFVELNKLLKFENVVMSGGEAKQLISSGLVRVDGEVEERVRRKLVAGNRVQVADLEIQVVAKPQ